MKFYKYSLFTIVTVLLVCFNSIAWAGPSAKDPGYFQLRVYHMKDSRQESAIDSFLQYQYMPALHSAGVKFVGVYKAVGNDTATDKKMYVFIPYSSLKQFEKISADVKMDAQGGSYINAVYNNPAYVRQENILIQAFKFMPELTGSKLTGAKSERVYELRSYEGASENLFRNKVQMFNEGGEIDIFSRLGFNAVFYGSVLFGAHMPNLMYMTSFENMQSREEHWKAFGADPTWKKISSAPEYQNNVSHADIVFLHPTEYSDL